MATFSITIPPADVPRVLAAFTQVANQMKPVPPVVVNQAWAEAWMKEQIRSVVREYERSVAQKAAQDALVVPPDIT